MRKVCDAAVFLLLSEPAGSIPAGEPVCNFLQRFSDSFCWQGVCCFVVSQCEKLHHVCPHFSQQRTWDLCTADRCVLLCTQSRENRTALDAPAAVAEKMDLKINGPHVLNLCSINVNRVCVGRIKGFFLPAGFRILPPKFTSTAELTRTVPFSGPKVSSKAETHQNGIKRADTLKGWAQCGPNLIQVMFSFVLYYLGHNILTHWRTIIYNFCVFVVNVRGYSPDLNRGLKM